MFKFTLPVQLFEFSHQRASLSDLSYSTDCRNCRDNNYISCIFSFDSPRLRSSHGGCHFLRAKRNTRLWLLFILPSGKKDLIFIKNREQHISSSHDFITSGYSSEADHTQPLDLKHHLSLFSWPTIWIWGFTELWGLCQRCASQDFIRLGIVSVLAVTWTELAVV